MLAAGPLLVEATASRVLLLCRHVPLGHPLAPILAYWLDNHMFVASSVDRLYRDATLSQHEGGRRARQGLVDGRGAGEDGGLDADVPLLHYYPVRTDVEEMWEEGHVMLGFDAEERLIQRLPHQFAEKIVWGSRYPHHDTTSAWDAIAMLTQANVEEPLIARMLGGNAAEQFGIELVQTVGA